MRKMIPVLAAMCLMAVCAIGVRATETEAAAPTGDWNPYRCDYPAYNGLYKDVQAAITAQKKSLSADDEKMLAWNAPLCDDAVWNLVKVGEKGYDKLNDLDKFSSLSKPIYLLRWGSDMKMPELFAAADQVYASAEKLGIIKVKETKSLAALVGKPQARILDKLQFKVVSFDPVSEYLKDPSKLPQGMQGLGADQMDALLKAIVQADPKNDDSIGSQVSAFYKSRMDLFNEAASRISKAAASVKIPAGAKFDKAVAVTSAGQMPKSDPKSNMNVDSIFGDKTTLQTDPLYAIDPAMSMAARAHYWQVTQIYWSAKQLLGGKKLAEAEEALKQAQKAAADVKAHQATEAKAGVLATALANALNTQKDDGTLPLPDAKGKITVAHQTGDKETVFTATDQAGTSVKLKVVPNTDIDKITEETAPTKAAEVIGDDGAQDILNGNFRAAQTSAVSDAVKSLVAPGADGKMPSVASPGGVLGPGGALGGEAGCGAARGDSLADYQKKLDNAAKANSAANSAARQDLEGSTDQEYEKIVKAHDDAVNAANANPLLTDKERAAAIAKADKAEQDALGPEDPKDPNYAKGLRGRFAAQSQKLLDGQKQNEVSKIANSLRAERLLRGQVDQRINGTNGIRDAWQKDVSLAQKHYSGGDLSKYLTPEVVKDYFTQEWSAGSPHYADNMDACISQVQFNNPASVDEFVGKHLANWCKSRKKGAVPVPEVKHDAKSDAAAFRRGVDPAVQH